MVFSIKNYFDVPFTVFGLTSMFAGNFFCAFIYLLEKTGMLAVKVWIGHAGLVSLMEKVSIIKV